MLKLRSFLMFFICFQLLLTFGCKKTNLDKDALDYLKEYSIILDSIDVKIGEVSLTFELIDEEIKSELYDSSVFVNSWKAIAEFEMSLNTWMESIQKRKGFKGDVSIDLKTLEFIESVRFSLIPIFTEYIKNQEYEAFLLKSVQVNSLEWKESLRRQMEVRESLINELSRHTKREEHCKAWVYDWYSSFKEKEKLDNTKEL